MAKELVGYVKLQVMGGAATPAAPVGPALGSKGLNIMDFCTQFNSRTQDKKGEQLAVVISVYKDKSFDFVIKSSPAPLLIKKLTNIKKGSSEPNRNKVASLTWDQVKEIANIKMNDLNAFTSESAMKMVAGTARSMGVTVTGDAPFQSHTSDH